MKAEDVMARDVLTVTPTTSIEVAIALMLRRRVSGLPVVDEAGKLAGVITEGDLLRRAETGTGIHHRSKLLEFLIGPGREASEFVHANSRRVGDLMTRDVITAEASTPLEDVVEAMEKHHIRRLPVVDGTKVIGVVSRADLLAALGRKLAAMPKDDPNESDDSIEQTLRSQLAASTWVSGTNIGVDVDDSVVTMSGFIYDERTRKALMVAAQNVPGVKQVVDKLVWIDTTTGMVVP
jgi:CBS-domain-containing membrane protein